MAPLGPFDPNGVYGREVGAHRVLGPRSRPGDRESSEGGCARPPRQETIRWAGSTGPNGPVGQGRTAVGRRCKTGVPSGCAFGAVAMAGPPCRPCPPRVIVLPARGRRGGRVQVGPTGAAPMLRQETPPCLVRLVLPCTPAASAPWPQSPRWCPSSEAGAWGPSASCWSGSPLTRPGTPRAETGPRPGTEPVPRPAPASGRLGRGAGLRPSAVRATARAACVRTMPKEPR